MKKILAGLALAMILSSGCKKYQLDPMPQSSQPSVVGTWNVDSVTTYFYDANGLRNDGVHVYPEGAPDYPYHFQFRGDDSLIESLHLPSSPDYTVAKGIYSITSDTSFTLVYPTATSSRELEPCKIVLISDSKLIFSKELQTVFDGSIPGYIKYVYQLTKL